jgi:hypothetical protein
MYTYKMRLVGSSRSVRQEGNDHLCCGLVGCRDEELTCLVRARGRFRGDAPTGRAAYSRRQPFWTPHSIPPWLEALWNEIRSVWDHLH